MDTTHNIETLEARVLQTVAGILIQKFPLAELNRSLCGSILRSVLQVAGIDKDSIEKHLTHDENEAGAVRDAVQSNNFQPLVDRCRFYT